MEIEELTLHVDRKGRLEIPPQVLQQMKLQPGDSVCLAFLLNQGKDVPCEFFLTPDGLENTKTELAELAIPQELMAAAGIPSDADLEIACIPHCIAIYETTDFSPEELDELLNQMGIMERALHDLENSEQKWG